MKKYDKIMVKGLLDSYENSSLFRGTNEKKQGIYFRITKKAFPEYFDETSVVYDLVHQAVNLLEYENIAEAYWKDNKVGHILEKVSLNLDNIDAAYHFVSRVPLKEKLREYEKFVEKCPYKDQTISELFMYLDERLQMGEPIKKYVDLNNLDEFSQVLKGVHAVLHNEKECFVRELSMLLYGDSKMLEALRAKIESIMVNFYPQEGAFENTEDVFQEFNVIKNPSLVVIKGAGIIRSREGALSLSGFCQGIGLSSEDLEGLTFETSENDLGELTSGKSKLVMSDVESFVDKASAPFKVEKIKVEKTESRITEQVKRIVTIENLTTFHRFKARGVLAIYLGGFHNKARRNLICKAHEAYPSAELFHWGDIDAGGFRIYFDLCHKTGLRFRPMNMGIDTLEKYKKYAKTITDNDIKAIENLEIYLANSEQFPQEERKEIFEVLDWMLENKLKLEQEIVAYMEGEV